MEIGGGCLDRVQKAISQPYLFPELEQSRVKRSTLEKVRERDARVALRALYRLRNRLGENAFEPVIKAAIDEIRIVYRAEEEKFREKILFSVERQGATTATEISGDTRIGKKHVEQVLVELEKEEVLYRVPKFIPGSDRQYYMWKSNRTDSGEMDDIYTKGVDEIDYLV